MHNLLSDVRKSDGYVRQRTARIITKMHERGWRVVEDVKLVSWLQQLDAEVVKLPTALYRTLEDKALQVAQEFWAEEDAIRAAQALRAASAMAPEEA